MWVIVYENFGDKRETGEEVLQWGVGDQKTRWRTFFMVGKTTSFSSGEVWLKK